LRHVTANGRRPKRYMMEIEGQKHVVEVEEVA
jgi:hypothetical protein